MEGSTQSRLTRIVKLQYKNFEPGEFTGEQQRSYEETIALIEAFPWQAQRDQLRVDLTNPSVTIEGQDQDYLKLSPYYNGKMVLHYFDAEGHLYTHSFDQPSGTYPLIRSFFDDKPFDPAGLKKENTWLQSNANHFRTGNFHYSLKPIRFIFPFLAFVYFSILAALCTFGLGHLSFWLGLLTPLPFLYVLFRLVALTINHYEAAKEKVLMLSRGKEEFSFGPPEALTSFNKKDIQEIITYGLKGRGGDYPSLTKVEIQFIDGSSICISNLIIQQVDLIAKFPNSPHREVSKFFPFITPAASTPS